MGKVRLFIGKGGVGKSTCSSLFSVREAQGGQMTLLVSMDPAHNLHDIFQQEIKGKDKKITSCLYARETDLDGIRLSYMKSLKKELAGVYHYQQALNIDKYFNILKFAPGMEEYAAWLALEACFQDSRYDQIIVDTPPTALTLKTISLSAVNLYWIDQLEAMRLEILQKKNTVGKIRKENLAEPEDDPVYQRLQKMKKRYQKVTDALQDPERSEINLVMNEDELSFSESLQIKKDLEGLSIPISRIIVNKSRADSVQEMKIAQEFSPAEIEILPLQDSSPTGLPVLEICGRQFREYAPTITIPFPSVW